MLDCFGFQPRNDKGNQMKIINSIKEWQTIRKQDLFKNKSIGFVPTMGNLHAGHESLLLRSTNENDLTILSIFVNPTQFNDPNDLKNYPRTFEEDINMAKQASVDFILAPQYDDLYPDNYRYKVSENIFSKELCGKHRPGHFDGVLTVVLKLLSLVKPDRTYFGEKDYQQLQLIKDMVMAFFLDIEIIPCPTIRDTNGLALSSRNNLLSIEHRAMSHQFYQLLNSDLSIPEIVAALKTSGFEIDYIEEHFGRRFGAVKLGNVRLIDNVKINSGDHTGPLLHLESTFIK